MPPKDTSQYPTDKVPRTRWVSRFEDPLFSDSTQVHRRRICREVCILQGCFLWTALTGNVWFHLRRVLFLWIKIMLGVILTSTSPLSILCFNSISYLKPFYYKIFNKMGSFNNIYISLISLHKFLLEINLYKWYIYKLNLQSLVSIREILIHWYFDWNTVGPVLPMSWRLLWLIVRCL